MKAMILAAGPGTRLRPLTDNCPKAMLPVGGRPLLHHAIDLLRSHGVTDVVINLHHLPESVIAYFGNGQAFGVRIFYSREDALLGTAGAVKKAAEHFQEAFLVIYGDLLTDLDLTAMGVHHRNHGSIATLALHAVGNPQECGIVEMDSDGWIRRFVEKPAPQDVFSNLANAGVYVLEPEVLRHVPEGVPCDFGRDVFPSLLRNELKLSGYPVSGYLIDIGSPEKYRRAEADWRHGRLARMEPPDTAPSSTAVRGL
jgi:NDP-sugar pyrophosphorylase family protein